MIWKHFFVDNPELEEQFQAFRSRIEDDPCNVFDLEEETKRQLRQGELHAEEEHYLAYEKQEYYRKQWARKNGYTFKPKEYDPEKRYR